MDQKGLQIQRTALPGQDFSNVYPELYTADVQCHSTIIIACMHVRNNYLYAKVQAVAGGYSI